MRNEIIDFNKELKEIVDKFVIDLRHAMYIVDCGYKPFDCYPIYFSLENVIENGLEIKPEHIQQNDKMMFFSVNKN